MTRIERQLLAALATGPKTWRDLEDGIDWKPGTLEDDINDGLVSLVDRGKIERKDRQWRIRK